MSGWREALRAKTAEEAARRRFGLWALVALIVGLPLWWWIGADLAAAALKPVAGLFLRLFGLTGEIRTLDDGGWALTTGLRTADGRTYVHGLTHEVIKRLLLGVPLYVAFLIAPPRAERMVRAAVVGAAVLAGLFLFSLAAVIWGEIAPMLNPALATEPNVTRLAGQPLNPIAAQIALIGRYLALSVAPLIVTVVTWAAVNPAGRHTLLGALDDQTPADEA